MAGLNDFGRIHKIFRDASAFEENVMEEIACKGGLGIRNLSKQNKCLLQKFLIRFHSEEHTPWLSWIRNNYGWNADHDFGDDLPNATPVWKDIYATLPSFRQATKVIIGNGRMTTFWIDLWWGSCFTGAGLPSSVYAYYKTEFTNECRTLTPRPRARLAT